MESDCILYQSNPLHLNLLCQGAFRRNWVTWPRSLSCGCIITSCQVRRESERLYEKLALLSNVSRIGYVAQCNLILNYSSRTACINIALQYMIEYDEIANHFDPLDLNLNLILSGSIPAELGNLTLLTKLRLDNNTLSGEKRIFIEVASFFDFWFFFFEIAGCPSSILKLNKTEISLQDNLLGKNFNQKIDCGFVEVKTFWTFLLYVYLFVPFFVSMYWFQLKYLSLLCSVLGWSTSVYCICIFYAWIIHFVFKIFALSYAVSRINFICTSFGLPSM